MGTNPQFPADLFTFTKEILNGKLHLLCSVIGLPIHGTVDGFSRKCFFVEAVKEFGFCPNLLRTDAGTQNSIMASIQCALRKNTVAY